MRPPSNSPNLARRLQFCGVVLLLLLLALYYNWAMTEKAGQYIGYKTLTTKIKLEIYLNKQPDTSWHGQSQFILDHMKTHPLPQSVAKHVVDLGAHDGVWLSNSFPFVQVRGLRTRKRRRARRRRERVERSDRRTNAL